MAKQIWKFPIPITGEKLELTMPVGSEILHIAAQYDVGALWALVDSDPEKIDVVRTFHIFGTGHDVPSELAYVGTWLVAGGTFVWHLFEEEG